MKRWILISLSILAVNGIVEARTLLVPSPWYPSIQSAITAANSDDTIIISPGTYNVTSGYSIDKNITIKGSNPDDPNVVATTVIRKQSCGSPECSTNRPFIFNNTVATLDGLTITTDGGRYHGRDQDPNTGPGGRGDNGGSVAGGVIGCFGSSPTIKNCVISNSYIRGGSGGTGGNGGGTGDSANPNGGPGGEPGYAYGAGLYCSASSPNIINCSFIDCTVADGNGGDGGNGITIHGVDGIGGCPGGYANRANTGLGGAVYISSSSYPKFTNCKFINNRSFGGPTGIKGLNADPPWRDPPNIHYKIDTLGGAVYIAAGGSAKFDSCIFTGNIADNNDVGGEDSFVSFGGAVAAEGNPSTAITFNNCIFSENSSTIGGALFWHDTTSNSPLLDNCNFSGNSALHGGGVYFFTSSPKIARSNFSGNTANGPGDEAGQGGGIYGFDTDAQITDCNISGNTSLGSGGGLYIASWYKAILLKSCLVTHNTANRDGGGVSLDWSSNPAQIKNCTIADNTVTGSGFPAGYGGGLYTSYDSSVTVTDSILWGNTAPYGRQIAVGAYAGMPSNVRVRYSDVQGGAANVFVDSGCTLNWETNNKEGSDTSINPLFISGCGGNYYLSQTAAGQSPPNSPCVDSGSDDAGDVGLYRHTTRTDRRPDPLISIVDIGYHFLLTADVVGDFTFDGVVDFNDYAILLSHNGETGCSFPEWCNGTDLNRDGSVNADVGGADYIEFAKHWRDGDTTPPMPNPMNWVVPPASSGSTSITMTAMTAYDNSSGYNVEYYFEETSRNPGSTSSGWQTSPIYTDTGLTTGTQYSYWVKARDKWGNETGRSFVGYAVPVPSAPAAPGNLTATAASSSQINLVWTDNSDNETGFKIERKTGTDPFSQIATVGSNITTYGDPNLTALTTYTYQVRAYNTTGNSGYSNEASTTTLQEDGEPNIPPPSNDITPPLPNPSQWAVKPVRNVSNNQVYMEAVAASDVTTGGNDPVSYYFDCTSGGCLDSVWQSSPIYTFTYPSHCIFRVRTKDNVGNTGQYSESWYTGW